jgi:hypothetical protein
VSFGFWRENDKRFLAAALAVVLVAFGVCLSVSSPRRSVDIFRQNIWYSFFNAMKAVSGSATEEEILGSNLREQVFQTLKFFADAFDFPGICGVPYLNYRKLAIVRDDAHDASANGADMVSRE